MDLKTIDMKSLLIMLCLVLVIYSCSNGNNEKNPQLTHELLFKVPKDKDTLYYPLDDIYFVLDSNRQGDGFIKSIYSKILFNLQEPVLYNYKGDGEVLRFLWMRPFDNPIVIRVNKVQDTVYMNLKELGKDFYNSDSFSYKKTFDTTLMLDSNEWRQITNNVVSDRFFNLSSYDPLNDNSYKDATIWLLECRLGGEYHCINRLYLDTLSLNKYSAAKKLFDMGNSIVAMKNHKEQ